MTDDPPVRPRKPRAPRAAGSAEKAVSRPARKPGGRKPAAARGKAAPRPLLWAALWVAVLTLALDQVTKWYVVRHLRLAELYEINVVDPYLSLRMAWNQGVNFGLFASEQDLVRWALIAVAGVICVWVAVWLVRSRPGRWVQIAAGLLIGGALGNVIDRVIYGAVADFLNMSLPSWRNPYSFNVADIAIFAGALGLVLLPGTADGGQNTRDAARKTR